MYASDKFEALQVLTPEFIEKLLSMRDKYTFSILVNKYGYYVAVAGRYLVYDKNILGRLSEASEEKIVRRVWKEFTTFTTLLDK